MRLYPPAYLIGRQAVRAVELRGLCVPKGRIVLINVYGIHRRADLYPEPERFLPERWTPEFEQRLPRFGYLPFGGGPRICIGNHFAMMEGHQLLATLARRVVFETRDDAAVEPEPLITLRPKNGVHLRVQRRAERRARMSAA
jgi:cytochrome P450